MKSINKKGIAQLDLVLTVIASIFVIGLLVMIYSLTFVGLRDTQDVSNPTNDTILANVNSAQTLSFLPSSWSSATALNQTWLEFDGVDDRINVTNPIIGTTAGTFCGIVNISSENGMIFTNGQFEFVSNDFNNRFSARSNSTADNTLSANTAIQYNKTSHLCVSRNSTNALTFYVNGSSSGTEGQDSGVPVEGTNMFFGVSLTLTADFGGSMDDLRMWNKSLSSTQVNSLFNESFVGKNLGKRVPIIMYHCIGDENPCGVNNVNETNFDAQMSYLNSSGYESITLKQYYAWTQGTGTVPNKPIVLTFDDGWTSIRRNASNIMDDYGFVGVADIIGTRPDAGLGNYSNWSEIQELVSKGWEIASHSENHCDMIIDCNTTVNWTEEFEDSIVSIESNLTDVTVKSFVPPFNSWNATSATLCLTNYDICTGDAGGEGSFVYETSQLGNLNRIGMVNTTSLEDFRNYVNLEDEELLRLSLNENQGTTAHDVSGNANNGTITGATWANDGVDVLLTNDVDYNQTGKSFTILNTEYAWSQLIASYAYTTNELNATTSSILASLGGVPDWFPIVIVITFMVVLITLTVIIIKAIRGNGVTVGG